MMLAPQADGAEIETIEGVAQNGELTPVQKAFHEQHGLQCGYCTPGLVMAATFLLRRNPNPSEEEIRRAIRGNICRCTGYMNIVRSIQSAAAGDAGAEPKEAA
jgi:carbon-monoxide dehydrogenase small subunit